MNRKLPPHISKITLPIHSLTLVGLVFFSYNPVSLSWLWATFIGWILISGFGIAIGYHRYLSHDAFEANWLFEKIFIFLGCLGCQGSPIFWPVLHNHIHHKYSDTNKDLHSPVLGWWSSYMGWQFVLQASDIPFRYGSKFLRKPYLRFLHKHYYKVVWSTLLIAALIDYRLFFTGLVFPMCLSIHQENLIDLFCHLRWCGYRNFETKDNSVNNFLLGLFAFGQGWHNNHHAHPRRYDFGGERWFEFDICRLLVPIVRKRHGFGWRRKKVEAT